MDLNFKVEGQTVKRTDKNTVVNLSENYLRLCFNFETTDWNNLTKFILFKHSTGTTRIGLTDNNVIVPSSLLTGNRFVFSLYGLDNQNDTVYRITTNLVRIKLVASGYTSDVDDPIDDEEIDIVEEIYIAINAKVSYEDVKNNLTSTDTNKPLSAKQGKILQDTKVNISDIKDNLISSDEDKPLSANQGKNLKDLVDSIVVVKQDSAEDGYFATYNVKVDNVVVGEKINIPKDYLLKDADIKVCDENDVPVEGYRVGDYYFDFMVNTEDSSDPKHLYLLCNSLKDVYSGDGSTIVISDNVISVKSDVFASKVHTHTKSDVTDFSHNHDERYYTESETDILLNGKSDTNHNHDSRYYTESEVDALIEEVKYDLDNRVVLQSDKNIIQTDERANLSAYAVIGGMPQGNKDIYFYIKEEQVNDS